MVSLSHPAVGAVIANIQLCLHHSQKLPHPWALPTRGMWPSKTPRDMSFGDHTESLGSGMGVKTWEVPPLSCWLGTYSPSSRARWDLSGEAACSLNAVTSTFVKLASCPNNLPAFQTQAMTKFHLYLGGWYKSWVNVEFTLLFPKNIPEVTNFEWKERQSL